MQESEEQGMFLLTYQLKLYPTPAQEKMLNSYLVAERYFRNKGIALKIEAYEKGGVFCRSKDTPCFQYFDGKSLSKLKLRDLLSYERKHNPKWDYVPAVLNAETAFTVHKTYNNFFKGKSRKDQKAGYPKFKKQKDIRSFAVSQSVIYPSKSLGSGFLKIPQARGVEPLPPIRFRGEELPMRKGTTGRIVVKKNADGWYASVPLEPINRTIWRRNTEAVGIDLNIGEITCYTSEGREIRLHMPIYQIELESRIVELNKKTANSRRAVGLDKPLSNRCQKMYNQMGRLHQLLARRRKAWQRHCITWLVQEFGEIYVEDLQVANMAKNKHLSRSILNEAWGQFCMLLEQKCQEHARTFARVDPRNTSRACSACGWIKENLTLAVREWTCGGCGRTHDRDINAAQNVLARGRGLALPMPEIPSGAVVIEGNATQPDDPEVPREKIDNLKKAIKSKNRKRKRNRGKKVVRTNRQNKKQAHKADEQVVAASVDLVACTDSAGAGKQAWVPPSNKTGQLALF